MEKSLFKEFLPWIAFSGVIGLQMGSVPLAAIIALALYIRVGRQNLKEGFLLDWASIVFFSGVLVVTNGLHVTLSANEAMLLANSALAGIVWLTILIGKPFTEQYARREAPKEYWHLPMFKRINRACSLLWAGILSLTACASYLALQLPTYSNFLNNYLSIAMIVVGVYSMGWLVNAMKKRESQWGVS